MKKFILVIALLGAFQVASFGQAEKDVEDVIIRLFKGMHDADSAMVSPVFTNDLTMATVAPDRKTGEMQLTKESGPDGFLKAIATKRPEPLSEEIWNLVVQVDGDFAQAWCDYALYLGNKFIHCGVDAFHLFKTENGWKIFHIADTRRKEGCVIPDEIQKKHKE